MITVQIATLPERESHLSLTVASLIGQVDSMFVALNGHKEVPSFLLDNPKISYLLMDNSLGDGAKFYGTDKLDGYIFTCDDDLIYPQGYVEHMIQGLKRHGGIVTALGKRYDKLPVESFGKGFTRLYSCLNRVHNDVQVHVGGTGVMAWHSDTIKINPHDFSRKNMADIWVSKLAYEQNIKITVLSHPRGYVIYNAFPWRIWAKDRDDAYQTEILNSFLK